MRGVFGRVKGENAVVRLGVGGGPKGKDGGALWGAVDGPEEEDIVVEGSKGWVGRFCGRERLQGEGVGARLDVLDGPDEEVTAALLGRS